MFKFEDFMRIHFIAIGGSAMHNLAIALQLNGYDVTGSDDEIFEPSKSRLLKFNLLPQKVGWYPDELNSATDAIILGMHAKPDNPELIKAQKLGLKIYSYPEFLYYHSKNKKRIVIGGSHGKTTITGIVMHVLKNLGLDFDYLVGSKLKDFDVMARLNQESPIMVFEGDEYLSSPIDRRPKFHWYKPHIALLSGIAWDHINVFPTLENYVDQFKIFIELIEKNGTLIYNQDDSTLKDLVEKSRNDIKKIGYSLPVFNISNGITNIIFNNRLFPLRIFGKHNLANINGSRLICNQLGISDEKFYESVTSFDGTANRLELIEDKNDKYFFKDFAHAPSKVLATVNAVKEQFPQYYVVACLELHTFSSLNKNFLKQYEGSLSGADSACVYFNNHALRLKKLPALDKDLVGDAFKYNKLAVFNNSSEMIQFLEQITGRKVVFLMMSSGNFDGVNMKELAIKLLD
jgi:UDP-N-acetylmuramate: L-alanyl-gamma-D-glutamyl-meso-diaminopimelate ligase